MRCDMLHSMRATITIGDELFAEADRIATAHGISRSRLYQEALESHLRLLREDELTAQMNRHIERHGQPIDESFREYVAKTWAADMGDDEW